MALPPPALIAVGVIVTAGLVVLAVGSSSAMQRRIVFLEVPLEI